MIKTLLTYTLSFVLLFFAVLHAQDWLLKLNNHIIRFSFYDTTLFFATASAIICLHLKIFSQIKSLQPQLGYIYLPTLMIKGGVFFVAFKSTVFSIEKLSNPERLCLLLPLLIFLVLEVYFVIQILKENAPKI